MSCSLVGANTRLCLKAESAWGAPPAAPWTQVPFITADFGAADDMSGGDVLGYGRDAQRQSRDGVTVRGRIAVPLDLDAIGHWVTAALGPAVSSGTTDYLHTWNSGAVALPSLSLEFQHPDGTATPLFVKYRGVLVDSLAVSMAATGRAQVDIGLIGIDEVQDNVSLAGTATVVTPVWFDQSSAFVNKDTVPIAKVTAAALTLANHFDAVKTVGSFGLVSCADPGMFTAEGEITVRDSADPLAPIAKAATTFDLFMGWQKAVAQSLAIELFAAELVRRPRPIRGPGAIDRVFTVLGSRHPTSGIAATFTLRNQTATY